MTESPVPLPPSLRIDAGARRIRLDPADPAFVQNPYPAYAAIRAAGPIHLWEEYGHWCVFDHAGVNGLFRDRRFGRDLGHVVSREALGWPPIPDHLQPFYAFEARSMLECEPPVHTRLRTAVNRAFVSREVERLRPRIAALAHDRIDAFADEETVDLLPAFAEPIPVLIIAEALGVPADSAPQLLDWSHRMVAMYQYGRTRAVEDAAVAATLAFSDMMRSLLADRRRRRGPDILSLLLDAEGDGLDEEDIVSNAILLLNAGHEATVHAIGNAVATLLGRGIDTRGLFATPEGSEAAVEELLRIEPPLHLFTRYALQDVTLGDVTLRLGERIGLVIGAANSDPAVFADPDRFDPGRGARAHLAFGAGIHFCIGAPLARLELAVALPILFARLPRLALAEPPRFADRYHFHGLDALRVHPRGR